MNNNNHKNGSLPSWFSWWTGSDKRNIAKISLFSGSCILALYLTSQLFGLLFPKVDQKKKKDSIITDNISIKELVDLVFPFSYLLTTRNTSNEDEINDQESIHIEFEYLDDLLTRLQDAHNCFVAVYEAKMLNKIFRLLFSGEHEPTGREIHTALWIILHCLLRLNSYSEAVNSSMNIQTLTLQIFSLSDFFEFLVEAPLTQQKARTLFQTKKDDNYVASTYPSEAFKYSIEIVWLAYAIIAHFYSTNSSVLVHIRKRLGSKRKEFGDKHLTLLRSNKQLMNMLLFEKMEPNLRISKFPIEKDNSHYGRNEVFVDSSSGEIAKRNFEQFLIYTNKLINSDDASLVQLSLTAIGQLCANCKIDMLDYILYEQKSLPLASIFDKLMLCEELPILQTLAKTLFTISMRDRSYLVNVLMARSSFINEIVHLAIFQNQMLDHSSVSYNIQVQFLNLLFLMVLNSESLSVQLIENKQINILNRIAIWLELATSNQQHLYIQLIFSALQLLYGLCQHGSGTQTLIIAFYTKQKKAQQTSLFEQLRILTFIPSSPLLRYYSLLIWSTYITDGKYRRFLTKNEQLLKVLMSVLKEEEEVTIKRLAVQLLRQLCRVSSLASDVEDARYELNMLLNHFNLLFESVELLRFYMSFLASFFEKQRKKNEQPSTRTATSEDQEKYVKGCIDFVLALFFLLATCANESVEAKEMLLGQYEIHLYINDLLKLLRVEMKDDYNYNRVLKTAESVFNFQTKEQANQQQQPQTIETQK
jgi:hypothetical protein